VQVPSTIDAVIRPVVFTVAILSSLLLKVHFEVTSRLVSLVYLAITPICIVLLMRISVLVGEAWIDLSVNGPVSVGVVGLEVDAGVVEAGVPEEQAGSTTAIIRLRPSKSALSFIIFTQSS